MNNRRNVRELTCLTAAAALWLLTVASGRPQCLLLLPLPHQESLPTLTIQSQQVRVQIEDQVARVRLEQVFRNPSDRDAEADYHFPLPPDSTLREFALWIDGRPVRGEWLDSRKARDLYEEIVRKRRDPALIEYLGWGLLRVRLFPVPAGGEQKIEVEYSHLLPRDNNLVRFSFPVPPGSSSDPEIRNVSLHVSIRSRQPLRTIYSPTHAVDIRRRSDHEAIISFESGAGPPRRPLFQLYYGVSEQDIGLSLLSRRLPEEKGFFLLLVSPRAEVTDAEVLARDVCLVLDTSGSMAGEKMRQAREALKFCVNSLGSKDRFILVRFGTDTESFPDKLVEATADNRRQALGWIESLEARGGTALDEALQTALRQSHRPDRPYQIVLITDGLPTIGETNPDQILANVCKTIDTRNEPATPVSIHGRAPPRERSSASPLRIFTFGVGHDVNTHLLDRLARENRGLSDYIAPGEDIEAKVSNFYAAISRPVLADISLEFDGVRVSDLHPRQMPDLFAGGQLVVLGRYEGHGTATLQLRGTVNGQERSFRLPVEFARSSAEHEFLEPLWATRRVGYLLDEIRLRGESAELREEVIRLAKRYGIPTPYTSYLVMEEDRRLPQPRPLPMPPRGRPFPIPGPPVPMSAPPSDSAAKGGLFRGFHEGHPVSGADAVADARQLRRYQEAEAIVEELAGAGASVLVVAGKTFEWRDGAWVDQEAMSTSLPVVEIQFGSRAYFDLLGRRPQWKAILALGPRVTVRLERVILIVGETGLTTLGTADWQRLE